MKTGEVTEPASDDDASRKPASVFVAHQVPDFEAYLEQFNGNAQVRADAGVTRVIMARSVDDPHRVVLHFSAGSLDSVQKFLAGTEYEQLVEADRATESTLLWTATDELNELPAEMTPDSVSLFKKFPLSDFDCAVRALVAAEPALRAQGALGFSLHRSSVKADVAILHFVAKDRSAGEQAFAGEPLLGALTGCGASGLENPIVANNHNGA